MSSLSPEAPRSPWWTVVALLPAVLLAALAAPWPWLPAALGRLHPVVLHFPIALVLVVALLEVISLVSPRRGPPRVRLLLFLAAAGAVTASACGYLLMRGDAVEGALADRHLRGGLAVSLLACLTLATRLTRDFEVLIRLKRIYRFLLAATCAVLMFAAHDGASLTHGEDYLTEHLPWLQNQAKPPAIAFPVQHPVGTWEMYTDVVAPILSQRCINCHSGRQAKGKLALDTWEALSRGGTTGPLFVAGRPDTSLLVQRLELPLSHKERMPPKRKPQPAEGELALLRAWIKAGAPRTGTLAALGLEAGLLRAAESLPRTFAVQEGEPAEVDDTARLQAVAARRQTFAPALATAQARWPGVLEFEARDSAELRVNASLLGPKFGDADLAALAPLRDQITWLDLSGTGLTDSSARTLGTFKGLRLLRLNETKITDETVEALSGLTQLETLSLFRTPITDAAARTLASLPRIKTLSVAETPMTETTRRGLTRP
ncbi:MAG: hypothetical protein JNN01_22535 [Opitutaceae bacterium]|nr:hypothetical protein [Opitutaceae bacterium]